MAAPIVQVRVPGALLALLDAEAERSGRSRSAVILDALGAHLGGMDSAPERPAPKPKAEPRPPAARIDAPKAEKLAQAREAVGAKASGMVGRGVSVAAAMERAGVERWDGRSKRPAYQKGQAGAGKAKRR